MTNFVLRWLPMLLYVLLLYSYSDNTRKLPPPSPLAGVGIDTNRIERLLYHSALAHCPPSELESLDHVDVVERDGLRSVVSYDAALNETIVAFRGTTNLRNWVDNVDLQTVQPWTNTGIRIHRGFWRGHTALRERLRTILLNRGIGAGSHVSATGFSLGGALATVFALDKTHEQDVNDGGAMISATTFGAPKVGNAFLSKHVASNGPRLIRILHTKDFIPFTPAPAMLNDDNTHTGYRHAGEMLLYRSNESLGRPPICHTHPDMHDAAMTKYCADYERSFDSPITKLVELTLGDDAYDIRASHAQYFGLRLGMSCELAIQRLHLT